MSDTRSSRTSVRQDDLQRRADALIEACLRGERPSWPDCGDEELGEAILKRCDFHGTAGLLWQRLAKAGGWPRNMLEALRDRSGSAAIWEMQHLRYLTSLVPELASHGIEPIMLKGTALAYTCYDDAALRVRGDTDLLIPPASRDQADRLLGKLGFRRAMQVSGELVNYQVSYTARDRLGLAHTVDLHWQINNGQVLANLFSHAELMARAMPAPRLCREARATSQPDSILIACMHREVHTCVPYWVDGVAHFSPDRLIWLYDLHLLAENLTSEEQRLLVRLAHEKGLAGICHDGLARSAEVLGTNLPGGLLEALDAGGRREMPRIYLKAGATRRKFLDFRAIGGLGPKLRLFKELVFPPSGYMRERFADVRPAWLPWLYLRRIVMGTAGRLMARRRRRGTGPGV